MQDIILYADDTNVFFTGDNMGDLEIVANDWLKELSAWLLTNDLELNTKKTKCVIFRARNTPLDKNPELYFSNEGIKSVNSIKFLGVYFDEFLTWNEHTNQLLLKLSKVTGALWKLRDKIPKSFRLTVYYAMFQSQLNYCLLVWGLTNRSNILKLTITQKKAIRALENLGSRHSTRQFREAHEILNIQQLHMYNLALYVYKEMRINRYEFQQTYLSMNDSFQFRKINYRLPRIRTNYGLKTMHYLIPKFLNDNADIGEIIETCPPNSFKRILREYCFARSPF